VPAFTRRDLLTFMRRDPYAVQASVSRAGFPQAALVGVVVNDRFEVFFDTLDNTRKTVNLRHNPVLAFVFGATTAGTARTVQYEGVADEPAGADLDGWLDLYFTRFPDGRARRLLKGITYVRIKPTWIRHSDFAVDPPEIVELSPEDIIALG